MQFTVNNVFSKLKLWFSATGNTLSKFKLYMRHLLDHYVSCDWLKFIIKSFDKTKLSWNSTIVTGVDYTSSLFYSAKSVARVQKYQRKKLMSMRCWNCIHWFSFWTPATDFTQNERTAHSLCMIGALSRRISIAACCCTALLMFCFSIVSIHACGIFIPLSLLVLLVKPSVGRLFYL